MQIGAIPNRSLTAVILMRLVAVCARNLCSAKTVQSVLFDGQSALLHCPKFQVPGDIFSIECRTCEGTDAVGGYCGVCSAVLECSIKQGGPENVLCGREQLLGQRSLAPAHHLGIEPGCLHWIGTRGAVASNPKVAIVAAHATIGRDLQAPFERTADHFGINADSIRRGQKSGNLAAVGEILDEGGAAVEGAYQ